MGYSKTLEPRGKKSRIQLSLGPDQTYGITRFTNGKLTGRSSGIPSLQEATNNLDREIYFAAMIDGINYHEVSVTK